MQAEMPGKALGQHIKNDRKVTDNHEDYVINNTNEHVINADINELLPC